MAEQNRAAETKSDKRSRPKVRPTVVEELTDDLVGLAQLAGGPIAAVGGGTIQAQAARLGDRRLQSAQRRALAAQIGRVQGNRHLQRVVASVTKAAPAFQIARLVEYNEDVEGGRFTDPEQAEGGLPFTEDGWDGMEIARNLSQLDEAVARHDNVRCVQTSFLVALVQRGPGALRSMIENYLNRYRVGLRQASTPPRIKRWYRRSLRNLTPLLAKIDNKTLTYGDLSTILTEMYNVYGVGSGGTSMAAEMTMLRREGYEATRINKRNVDRDEAAEEAQDLEPGEFLSCGVEATREGTGEVGHAVHIGRHPEGTLYFYDPWPVQGDQMIECSEDLREIDHYFYNPIEESEEESGEETGEEEFEILEMRTFDIDVKYSPPTEEAEETE